MHHTHQDLLAYLTGKSDGSDFIAAAALEALPDLVPAEAAAVGPGGEPLAKRQRLNRDGACVCLEGCGGVRC